MLALPRLEVAGATWQDVLTEAATHSALLRAMSAFEGTMSKRYKNRICGYCGAVSVSGDHVLGRGFVLVEHRIGLPEIPACQRCNGDKSRLESHLMQVLPLGANSPDLSRYTRELMTKRAANPVNKLLREALNAPAEPVTLSDQFGNKHERIPIFVDASVIEQWCIWIARGLASHHWEIVTGDDAITDVIPIAAASEHQLLSFARSAGSDLIEAEIGGGVLSYVGVRFPDNSKASAWVLSLYGAMPIGGDPAVSTDCAKSWAVFIKPKVRATAA